MGGAIGMRAAKNPATNHLSHVCLKILFANVKSHLRKELWHLYICKKNCFGTVSLPQLF